MEGANVPVSERGMCNMDGSCAARRIRRDHHIGWALTRRHGTAIGLWIGFVRRGVVYPRHARIGMVFGAGWST